MPAPTEHASCLDCGRSAAVLTRGLRNEGRCEACYRRRIRHDAGGRPGTTRLAVEPEERQAGADVELDPTYVARQRLAALMAGRPDAGELALLLLDRPAWHAEAACRGRSDVSWFPARGEDVTPAVSICAACPVREQCQLAGEGERGIWGGLSERGRKRARFDRCHSAA